MKVFTKTLAAFSLLVLFAEISFATTCYTIPPPCFNHTMYDTIFTGTVKKIDSEVEVWPPMIEFDVVESFKGVSDKRTMRAFKGMSSASFDRFKVGEKYLIYGLLDEKDKNRTDFSTGLCAGTKSLAYAEKDIAYLRELNSDKPSYLIWGTFFTHGYDGTPKLEGVRAEVRDGNKKLVGTTDKHGDLRFEVSKEGEYIVKVFKPSGVELGMSEWLGSGYPGIPEMQPFRGGKKSYEYKVTVKNRKCGWFDVALNKERPEDK